MLLDESAVWPIGRSTCMSKHPAPRARALVTLVVLAVCLGARKIPLPTIVAHEVSRLGAMSSQSIMALGAQPLLSGYVLVEWAALLVPVWRPLRPGGPEGRAKLHHASLIVGMILALLQAFVMTAGLEYMGAARNPGAAFRVITVVILVGATAALAVLARIVDREGLGSGFSILLLAGGFPQIFGPIGNAFAAAQSGAVPSSALLTGAFGVALLVGATLWLFSSNCLPLDETWPHPALIGRPACGLAPLTVATAIVMFVAVLLQRLGHANTTLGGQAPFKPLAIAVLSLAAAVLCAFLFNRPTRIAQAWQALSPNPPEGIPRLKAVMLESVFFIALAVLVRAWLIQRLGAACVPNAFTVILLTGIICDLVREWRACESDPDLTPVWEIHQVYAVAPAMRLLKAEGIQAFAKGLRARSLLQFFGPYVPVLILAPAVQAQAAHALLQARWPRWTNETNGRND